MEVTRENFGSAHSKEEAPRWIEICGEKGRYTLADAEDGAPFSFQCTDGLEWETVTEMYDIVPITAPADDEILGYKYQLNAGGKWGFISKGFLQFIYPIYEDVVAINSNEGICLAAYVDAGSGKIDISFSRAFHCVNMHIEHRLLDIEYMYGEEQNINCFRNVSKEKFLPTAEARVERDSFDCGRVTFYKPSEDATTALMNSANGDGFEQVILELKDKILYGYRGWGSTWRIPAWELNIQSCCNLLSAGKLDYSVDKNIDNTTLYIVEKEGYYAIVSIDLKTLKITHHETPFAFTGIEKSRCRNCFYVDQFGKKGVYKMYSGESTPYIIPCEYETIELNSGENFVVKKKGKVGVISSVHGGWIEHLHPENH